MKKNVHPITVDLPDAYLIGIGKVIVQWAHVERLLAIVAYELLDIGAKKGRIAVRQPRTEERLTMIRQLLSVEGIKIETIDLDALSRSLVGLQKLRDLLAHSIWLKHGPEGKLAMQDFTGSTRPDPKGPKVAKRITPGALGIDSAKDFETMIASIRQVIAALDQLYGEVVQKRKPAREKSPERNPSDFLEEANSESKPQDHPRLKQ